MAFAALSHQSALRRIQKRGVDVRTIIDVGASNGVWSRNAEPVWPNGRYHLIEAFEHWREPLQALTAARQNYSFSLAAAGESDGEAYFHNSSDAPFGGFTTTADTKGAFKVKRVSIDAEVKRLGLQPPYLLKLDTHGAERDILAGAKQTLEKAEVLVVEVYNFFPEKMRFPAITAHIESYGFRVIDIGEPVFRPHDGAFWQMDLFFVRITRPEVIHQGY